MFKKFFPKQEKFFQMLSNLSLFVSTSAELLQKSFKQHQFEPISEEILQIKRDSFVEAQALFTLLHKTFITPFDRDDIHDLNSKLYDATNTINLTIQRCRYYKIEKIPKEMQDLVEVCSQAASLVNEVMQHVNNLSQSQTMLTQCRQIKNYESQADMLLMMGIASLYEHENDIKTILKLKEIYDLLESVTDCYQDIAFIVERIVLEYA